MKITIYGAGYVGLITGVCFAEFGNQVLCVDIDSQKIVKLKNGETPIYESGLAELLQKNLQAGRIQFTDDARVGVDHGLFQFIAVGTPSDHDGSADLRYVLAVAKNIGEHMQNYCIIVNKSTVPVSTADKVRDTITAELARRKKNIDFAVVSNPEFLKEGAAIFDFMHPDRIVVGTDNPKALTKMRELYAPLIDHEERFITMDFRSAELAKYAANAFLATKISFMNEMSRVAEKLGADIELVRKSMGTDPRIGAHFLFAGCGYGGACFPKDVRALQKIAEQYGIKSQILAAVDSVNEQQKRFFAEKIKRHFNYTLQNKVIALWGLAFKPNTNDMREASSRILLEELWREGAVVQAYDPIAMQEAQSIYGNHAGLKLCKTAEHTLINADALAIVTEWQEFRNPDFQSIKNKLRTPVIFDGRNLYDPQQMTQQGFIYYGIGRGSFLDYE